MRGKAPGPPPPVGDRRTSPRTPLVVREARCVVGIEVFFGCAVNVGRGGLFISSVRRREQGEVHEIQFEVPGLDRVFRCRARVVWARSYDRRSPLSPGFGLEFLDLPEEDRGALAEWVEAARASEEG